MNRDKFIKKGKRLKRIVTFLFKLRFWKRIKGEEHFVDTSHGKIKVLEYGFISSEVTLLYVDMHGGGFLLMFADFDEPMNLYFREKANVKIISIDYPKTPESPYPIAVEAVFEVVKHYVDNATAYKIDSDRIGIGGHSAGANVATVTCIKAKEKGGPPFRFQILDYPPLDLSTDPSKKPLPEKSLTSKLAVTFNTCYTDVETAKSPYVSPVFATTKQLSHLPPALLIVAGYDSLHDEGVLFHQKLKKAGVTTEFYDFPEVRHGFTYKKSSDAKKAHALIAEIIKKYA